ncbi:MAG: Gfo/Idh/MocA family oxidoreductase [Bacteroidota bacterium]
MDGKVKVGVIGVGHLGSLHAKMYSSIKNAEFIGVYDINTERAWSVAKEFRVRSFATIDELYAAVNAVSIATPTSTHSDIALQALRKGLHLFIEKPITKTVKEAELLIAESERTKKKVQIGHIERFNPAILSVGHMNLDPLFIESHRMAQFKPRGTDVAVVLDLMIHDIDIILSLVKAPVEKIDASGVGIVSENIDIANARIQFANGCVANVTASRISQRAMRKMRLFQSNAYISIDFSGGTAEVFRLVDSKDRSVKATRLLGQIDSGPVKRNIVYERPKPKKVNALQYELELFLQSILDDTVPVVSAQDGKRALEVAQEIIATIEKQQQKYRKVIDQVS